MPATEPGAERGSRAGGRRNPTAPLQCESAFTDGKLVTSVVLGVDHAVEITNSKPWRSPHRHGGVGGDPVLGPGEGHPNPIGGSVEFADGPPTAVRRPALPRRPVPPLRCGHDGPTRHRPGPGARRPGATDPWIPSWRWCWSTATAPTRRTLPTATCGSGGRTRPTGRATTGPSRWRRSGAATRWPTRPSTASPRWTPKLANRFPDRTRNAYPFAYEQVAQLFDHPAAPDLCVRPHRLAPLGRPGRPHR